KLMSDYNVGAVLVVNNSGDVAGILSERDVIRKVDSLNLSADIIDVEKIMSAKVLFVNGFQPIEECMEIMISKGIRHLPVYQEEKLVGMISIRDVLKQLILEQKTMIAHLENYINGI
ncbi:MAG: CBS domain-containing protein, partial [Chloroflexota bacterium]